MTGTWHAELIIQRGRMNKEAHRPVPLLSPHAHAPPLCPSLSPPIGVYPPGGGLRRIGRTVGGIFIPRRMLMRSLAERRRVRTMRKRANARRRRGRRRSARRRKRPSRRKVGRHSATVVVEAVNASIIFFVVGEGGRRGQGRRRRGEGASRESIKCPRHDRALCRWLDCRASLSR